MPPIPFDSVARLPAPGDNIAIATRRVTAGTQIKFGMDAIILSHTLLLGHRFAVRSIVEGEALLSWGQTFGAATKPIFPGDYVINADVLKELGRRALDFDLPSEPNFQNDLEDYHFDEANFHPAAPLERYADKRTFMGYQRTGGRGVGTRNSVVLLGTTALTGGFVRQLEGHLQDRLSVFHNIDGIVAVAHTEGGHSRANNQELLLRTLAGFIVHPNTSRSSHRR
ncbi:MAG: UxaA family hydrolase [Anaerolineae bacterium]